MNLLKRLFPSSSRKLAAKPAEDAQASEAVPTTTDLTPAPASAEIASDPRAPPTEPHSNLDEAEEAAETSEEELAVELEPDPYCGAGERLRISVPTTQDVADARLRAALDILVSPMRITLTDPAGPGSIADALAELESEGRVVSEVVDDPDLGPHLLYRARGTS